MSKLMGKLVEFKRRGAAIGDADERVGNRVQIEDANGNDLPALTTVVPTALSGTLAATGAIIAAPAAGIRIVVIGFVVQNEAATANTIQIHMGAATVGFRCFGQNQGDGLSVTFPAGREWRGAAATALTITMSAATTVGYSVLYFTETV